MFLAAFVLSGIINRYSPNKMAEEFISSVCGATFSIVCIGLANGVAYILNEGRIIDTILHGMAALLNRTSGYMSGVLMLLVQNLLNFFCPFGTGTGRDIHADHDASGGSLRHQQAGGRSGLPVRGRILESVLADNGLYDVRHDEDTCHKVV